MATITLRGSKVTTNGELPAVGSRAPEISLVDAALKNKKLSDYKGKKKLLSIVPSLDTSVCATSVMVLNELAIKHKDATILVISADLPFAQQRFCKAEDIKNVVTLSMMRSKNFAKDYGVLIQDGPLAGLCARAVVVLDENDKVIYTELVPEIANEPDYDKATEALL